MLQVPVLCGDAVCAVHIRGLRGTRAICRFVKFWSFYSRHVIPAGKVPVRIVTTEKRYGTPFPDQENPKGRNPEGSIYKLLGQFSR